MNTPTENPLRVGPAALCRMDEGLRTAIARDPPAPRILLGSCLAALAGSAIYGAVFGLWRSPEQALYSAVKMPFLIVSVTLVSSAVNTMLANALGARLSFRQVLSAVALGFAITCTLLAALSPVALLFVFQVPGPDTPDAMAIYRALLPAHTAVIGVCGIVGNVRLYRLLVSMTRSRPLAARVLAAWILVSGLAGCELSWVVSPFLARPDIPIPFFNPNAFTGNFFEYLWRAMSGVALYE
jgi:hypothetical protein